MGDDQGPFRSITVFVLGCVDAGGPRRNADIKPTVALRIPRKLDATEAFVCAIGAFSLDAPRTKDRTGTIHGCLKLRRGRAPAESDVRYFR
jgi:hypothetical protein